MEKLRLMQQQWQNEAVTSSQEQQRLTELLQVRFFFIWAPPDSNAHLCWPELI